ncbi:TPA: capsid protein [Clostridioides difficile]|uniref:minor capsid protein n=1 Tax=Clostridioides difficile TaxID=1496 RepID=UPI001BD17151|nr:minor capsid protein [Clostridioides difficile]MBS7776212.1 capsid protein [Clostridioides difficile]HBH3109881.1 capsid protein [Clostridioides difficile]
MNVHVDINATRIMRAKGIERGGKAQKFLTHEVRRLSDLYVPKQTGTLKNTAREEVDKIIYIQPYAKPQYYNNTGHGSEGIGAGGKRGKYWDKRMLADDKDELIGSVARFIGGSRE